MNMKRLLITVISLLALSTGLFAKGETYSYDYWDDIEKSPDAYRVSHMVYAPDLGLEKPLKNPSSLFAIDNYLYVVDTDNSRIIKLEYTSKKTLELVEIIDHVNPSPLLEDNYFKNPKDIFVSCYDGTIYIADTDNGRVIKTDKDLNVLMVLKEPDDPTYDPSWCKHP